MKGDWVNRPHTFVGHKYSGIGKIQGQKGGVPKDPICPTCNVKHSSLPTRLREMQEDYKNFPIFKTRKEREKK